MGQVKEAKQVKEVTEIKAIKKTNARISFYREGYTCNIHTRLSETTYMLITAEYSSLIVPYSQMIDMLMLNAYCGNEISIQYC